MTNKKTIGEMTPLGRERVIRRAAREVFGDRYVYIEHTASGGAWVQIHDIPVSLPIPTKTGRHQ
jgi:hypothetical protein